MFFLTHFLVVPCTASPFGRLTYTKTAGFEGVKRMTALLAKRNAIVLCGHIHRSLFVRYRSEEGTISQLTSFSLVPPKQPRFKVECDGDG